MAKKASRTKSATTKLEVVKSTKTASPKKAKATSPADFFTPFFKLPPAPMTKLLEETMTKSTAQFDKIAQEATAASRESFEAFTKSYGILTKGYESIVRTSVELSQSAAEKQAAYAKEALSCKTLNEFAEIQNKIAQSNFDDFMSSMTKLSEISTKVMTESAEPLNEQINKAVQKMSVAA